MANRTDCLKVAPCKATWTTGWKHLRVPCVDDGDDDDDDDVDDDDDDVDDDEVDVDVDDVDDDDDDDDDDDEFSSHTPGCRLAVQVGGAMKK